MYNYYGETITTGSEMEVFISGIKTDLTEIINKFLTPEQVLENPELAYIVGKVMEKIKEGFDLSEKMTRQLDQINQRISYLESIEKTLDSIEKKLEKKD